VTGTTAQCRRLAADTYTAGSHLLPKETPGRRPFLQQNTLPALLRPFVEASLASLYRCCSNVLAPPSLKLDYFMIPLIAAAIGILPCLDAAGLAAA